MEAAGPSRKRRKGGIRQREAAATQEVTKESVLYTLLMSYLAQGIISGAHCHAVAKAAKADLDAAAEGFHFPALNSLANLQHGKNLQQAIFNALKKEANLPQLQEVDIPLKGQPTLCASASVMLPHELFAALHENPNGWAKSILPDPDKLEAFWSAFQGHPCMAQHPLHKRKGYKTKCIPLALHGDEVPVTGIGKIWCRSALILSWNSLMATAGGASLEDTNLYIFGLFEKFILPASEFTQGTMAALWTLLRWSFDCIWQGKWPARDWLGNMCFGIGALAVLNLSTKNFFSPNGHLLDTSLCSAHRYPPTSVEGRKAGTQLAQGWYGCLLQLAGDLDYYAKYLSTPRWSSHSKCCSQCRATFEGHLSWLDNRPNSGWQNALLTPASWRSHFDSPCPLFQLPGLSALSITMDWMHCFFLGWIHLSLHCWFMIVYQERRSRTSWRLTLTSEGTRAHMRQSTSSGPDSTN